MGARQGRPSVQAVPVGRQPYRQVSSRRPTAVSSTKPVQQVSEKCNRSEHVSIEHCDRKVAGRFPTPLSNGLPHPAVDAPCSTCPAALSGVPCSTCSAAPSADSVSHHMSYIMTSSAERTAESAVMSIGGAGTVSATHRRQPSAILRCQDPHGVSFIPRKAAGCTLLPRDISPPETSTAGTERAPEVTHGGGS